MLPSYEMNYLNSKLTYSRFHYKSLCSLMYVYFYIIRCPLYAKLILRDNVTQLLTDTIDQQTEWGSVYTCEFASFAYLSTFAVSFISLWIHIVFRRVIRTERLLRLPIGLLTLIFTLITLIATAITTDGVIKFCTISEPYICSSSGAVAFSNTRWKVISLPVGMIKTFFFFFLIKIFIIGGWLTTLSILLNAIARGFQLFAKPKKSPETLKVLLGQLMANRHQLKLEKESSEYGSQISKEKYRSPVNFQLKSLLFLIFQFFIL